MRAPAVQRSLLEQEGIAKEIRLNDGSKILVRKREQWLAGSDYLIVLDRDGYDHHITYHNIAAIRFLKPNGRNGRKRRRR